MGLLEVIAEDLLVLARHLSCGRLDPVREPLVQLGPQPLGDAVVGRVTDQDVGEPERILLRELRGLRPDQLLPDEGLQ
jgi:hypothetical protein